ncbi:MAG TPA: DUF4199 domain-containing protein [Bacteroidia bacterium]|nr:DUF4199 domain-containing protein [Bacteroidia bacterium]
MNNYKSSLIYGFISGVVMIAIIMAIYFVHKVTLAGLFPRVIYVFLIFTMVWGGITIRRKLGGFSGFRQAFLSVFIISITATMLFDTFKFVLYKVVDPQLPMLIQEKKIEYMTEVFEKIGPIDEKADKAIVEAKEEDPTPTLKTLTIGYAESVVIGAILSLLIGLFVNRSEMRPEIKAGE